MKHLSRGVSGLYGAVVILFALLLFAITPIYAQESTPQPEATAAPVYVVRPGDTLYSIAQRFDSTVASIAKANGLTNTNLISVGQKLIIPTTQPDLLPLARTATHWRRHHVQNGELLPSLAYRYGTTVWHLYEANDLHWPYLLAAGQELVIPRPVVTHEGVPSYPQVSSASGSVGQGQTVLVEVESQVDLQLTGSFMGQDLAFVDKSDGYWALAGIDALTSPGAYPLTLAITETTSGDRLSLVETLTVTKKSFATYNIVVPASKTNLLDPNLSAAERRKVNAVYAVVTPEQLWRGTFGFPLEGDLRVTAGFGQRRSYNGGPVSSYHTGLDYGADSGVPVLAPITGTVALAEPLQVRGNAVILDHGWGVFTGFWHLSQIDVTEGQLVGPGDVVGLVGTTGVSTGPHLHWEMRIGGVPVNPLQWTEQVFP